MHHINGKGENSGVVYSEMQGRENTSGDLLALRYETFILILNTSSQLWQHAALAQPSGERIPQRNWWSYGSSSGVNSGTKYVICRFHYSHMIDKRHIVQSVITITLIMSRIISL